MLLGEFAALFAGTALPEGPLLAPTWVRFFVRLRAIVVVFSWYDVMFWEKLRAEIIPTEELLRSQSEARVR
jgi:hypothetical protein